MTSIEVKTRKWGNSIGITIPNDIVEKMNIKPEDKIKVVILKDSGILKDIFGSVKFKKSTEKLLQEVKKEIYNG